METKLQNFLIDDLEKLEKNVDVLVDMINTTHLHYSDTQKPLDDMHNFISYWKQHAKIKTLSPTEIKSREMEFIDEIATQITEMNFGFDTFKNVKEGEYKFTDEAQEYYNEMYDEYENLYINLVKKEQRNTDWTNDSGYSDVFTQ